MNKKYIVTLTAEERTMLAWIIHENIHRIGLVADGGLAGSQSPLWAPKSALRPLQPVYRGGLFSQMRSI